MHVLLALLTELAIIALTPCGLFCPLPVHSTGTYMVTVLASNPFGNQTAARRVFVLESPCSTPVVSLLEGAAGNQRGQSVTQGQEFKLETDVRWAT